MGNWGDIIIQGILLGGLYGLSAAGLSLMFGVMRLVNVAHGDMIIASAFLSLVIQRLTGVDSPFLCLPLVCVLMFACGFGLQRLVLNRALNADMLRPVLVTFGLSVVIQNGMLEAFSADSQRLQANGLEVASVSLGGGLVVGVVPLLIFASCVAVTGVLQWILYRTELGRAFRATSDDPVTAGLMGVNDRNLFAIATGIALAVAGIAGTFTGIRSSFYPTSGPESLLFAFEAVIIGGLGSLWGTLAGGIVLGVAQGLGAGFSSAWQMLAGHIAFLVVLMVRPTGLFPKRGN
ncbi:MAG: branched-chain amino acid ABC transporter permease [Proteobacteria bacterium]|nr:branched-chain amino acid ABC transporter permease [Pseudomonadota bacterium]